jgi:hypothetical protein
MGVFDWLHGKKRLDDAAMDSLARSIAQVLSVQIAAVGGRAPNLATCHGAKALGYVYGFIDAGLRAVGQDMADMSVGVPVTYQVLRYVFPDSEDSYLEFIARSIKTDRTMMAGVMLGGQQYIYWINGKMKAPMGLARCLIELEADGSNNALA